MAIPVYLFLTDDHDRLLKGSVDIIGREGSIELLGIHHSIILPTDDLTGKVTANRRHLPFMVEKEIDCSSPLLYRALTTGKTLKKVEAKWFGINDNGQEIEYFNTLMENVRVVSISPVMFDIKEVSKERFNHMEIVEFRYEKISWKFVDGNIIHTDDWNSR